MTTELDSFTIKDFEARYGVTRSNIYNRLNGLKDKGYPMEPEKQQGKSVFNADQIARMDELDRLLGSGKTIADFPAAAGGAQPAVLQDKSHLSRRTKDTQPIDAAPMTFGIASMIDAIAGKVADILVLRQSSALPSPDPLANLRAIQEACDRGWQLKTSQLAPLLGLKSLHGQEIKRHGFTFTRIGKIGTESAWAIKREG